MFYTGLDKYLTADVDSFTSDLGIRLRKTFLRKTWRTILRLGTSRKILVEEYPQLERDKQYVFAVNHSFDEDLTSALATIDRNVYTLQGTTDQTLHNPIFLALWLNGMIYVDRRNPGSRQQAVDKMKRILTSGSSIILFPEGGYNNTENQLVMPLFSSPWILSRNLGIEVVPFIAVPDLDGKSIHIRAGKPLNLGQYEKQEGMAILRDTMSTLCYDILAEHTGIVKRSELSINRMDWMEQRKQVYEAQKWHSDVWEEELTYYSGHNVTTPSEARKYADAVQVTDQNAWILADTLVKREEDKQYDLKEYLRRNVVLSK